MRKNQNQKMYALMIVFALLCMLFAFPVSAEEVVQEEIVETDAVLYGAVVDEDVPVADEETPAAEGEKEITLGIAEVEDDALTTGAETEDAAEETEEVFTGNAIGRWLDKTFKKIDYAVFTAVTKLHNEVMNVIVSTVTYLGDSEVAIPLLVLSAIMCFFKKTRRVGITVAFAIVLGTLFTNVILKNVCGRARPYVTMADDPVFMGWYQFAGAHTPSENSFPSGHTTCAFEMGVALFLSMRKKKIAWIFPTLAVIVGFTRLYLCVHYFTDVVAGVVVGTLAAYLAFCIMKAITKAIENKPALRDFDLAEKIKGLKKA